MNLCHPKVSAWFKSYDLLSASAERLSLAELSPQSGKRPLKKVILIVGQITFRHSQLNMFAHYKLVLLHTIPKGTYTTFLQG